MTHKTCDRCNKECEPKSTVYDHRAFFGFGTAELCQECTNELFRWLYGKIEKLNPKDTE